MAAHLTCREPAEECFPKHIHSRLLGRPRRHSVPIVDHDPERNHCRSQTGDALHRPFDITPSLSGKSNMNLIIWLVVGGVIGWLASIVMKTDGQQGIVLNVVVGIVGALIAGYVISPMVGVGTINQNNFSVPSLAVSFVGAVVLLAVVNLLRRGTSR